MLLSPGEGDLLRQITSRMEGARFIHEVDAVLRPLSYVPQAQDVVRLALEHLVSTNLAELEGSADEWFNLATRAARVDATAAELKILESALAQYPDNVDLLCNLFQAQYNHRQVGAAGETWQRLGDLGQEQTGPFWRYWVYGATYFARYLHDREAAVGLLDSGLTWVRLGELLNIYRHYRTVLLDGGSLNPLASGAKVREAHRTSFETIENRYLEGLALGIETGYVLATDLAKLLREHAARVEVEDAERKRAGDAPGEKPDEASPGKPEDVVSLLDQALHYLDIAELLYTNDPNHPVTDIYVEKAMALMARHRYAEALQIFHSLPEHLLDRSLDVMARYAAQLTGQEFRPVSSSPGGDTDDLLGRLGRLERELANQAKLTQGLLPLLAALQAGEEA